MKNYEKMVALIAEAGDDAKKFYEKGNNAAGTRLRKSMQEIKALAQGVRVEVSNIKNQ